MGVFAVSPHARPVYTTAKVNGALVDFADHPPIGTLPNHCRAKGAHLVAVSRCRTSSVA